MLPPRMPGAMKLLSAVLGLVLVQGIQADCGWYLETNDCICMNSRDGSLLRQQTATCCRDMGLKTTDSVRRWRSGTA